MLKVNKKIENNPVLGLLIIYLLSVVTNFVVDASSFRIKIGPEQGGDLQLDRKEENVKSEEYTEEIVVEVAGAVNSPGVYRFENDARIVDLIREAKGFTKEASEIWVSRQLNLADSLTDTQKVYIPFQWDEDISLDQDVQIATLVKPITTMGEKVSQGDGLNFSENSSSTSTKEVAGSINVNEASSEDLESLSGIGPAYAGKIIDNRPYQDFYELEEKSGVPAATLEKIENKLTF